MSCVSGTDTMPVSPTLPLPLPLTEAESGQSPPPLLTQRTAAITTALAIYLTTAPRCTARESRHVLLLSLNEATFTQLGAIADRLIAILGPPATGVPHAGNSGRPTDMGSRRAIRAQVANDLLSALLTEDGLLMPTTWAVTSEQAPAPSPELPLDLLLARYLPRRIAETSTSGPVSGHSSTLYAALQHGLTRARALLAVCDQEALGGPRLQLAPSASTEEPSLLTPLHQIPNGVMVTPTPCDRALAYVATMTPLWRHGAFPDGPPPSPGAIKQRRELLGWSLTDLARAARSNRGTVGKLETDQRHSAALRARIGHVLNEALERWMQQSQEAAQMQQSQEVTQRPAASTSLLATQLDLPPLRRVRKPRRNAEGGQHPWARLKPASPIPPPVSPVSSIRDARTTAGA